MKKFIHILIAAVLALPLVVTAVTAREEEPEFYVNDRRSTLSLAEGEVYALGADGTDTLSQDGLWALTADGTVQIYEPPLVGGGGLMSDDELLYGSEEKVAVGLCYYYDEDRDDSLEEAQLENFVGSGFTFGWLDENRNFVSARESTTESRLTLRPLGDTAVGVYATDTDELLYSMDATGKDRWLAVRPLSGQRESLTWFKQRRYCGDFAYADLGNDKLTVVNVVRLERYVLGVCAAEMGSTFPLEALKAQAVCARSYGVYNIRLGAYRAECGFDLTADTWCQAYVGWTDSAVLQTAVEETRGEYVTYQGQIAQTLYCAANGGETLDSEEVFPSTIPYLRGIEDPYEEEVWDKGPYGHRVGMSQWGAYAMAKNHDLTYKDILGFYYTGVSLSHIG